ncbi:transglycosylase SLT domain-containing protein [Marinibacterium profundimaris]|uniref:Lytic transglycosylase n=1 Tax=Marinibacterium profundimaris TaxID=1679460 RepID=A0A225NM99_9RHOB|nr:lytic transglycosylase [Marinibacterium profundimaris]OWU73578.1 lytic transglycosylase [Marinibacterium profundimaris]
MIRFPLALGVVLLLVSCSTGYKTAPANLDDACSIIAQRPEYMRAFRKAERKWGVPVHVQMATIYQESKFISNARTPHQFVLGVVPVGRQSSAYGYGQALDGTWDEYRRVTGNRGAKRDRIRDATDFMGWYFNRTLKTNGIPLDDAERQYLAYHEGHSGYARGSYRSKAWLMRVANEVDSRATVYGLQLADCR